MTKQVAPGTKIMQVEGDLLEVAVDAIVHQANLYHIFGGGVALQIGRRFPAVFEADSETAFGDLTKLGKISFATVNRPFGVQHVINMYSQEGMTTTLYDYMAMGLKAVRDHCRQFGLRSVGFPHGMGCGLANGYWPEVEQLIHERFQDSGIEVLIVKWGGSPCK